MHPNGHTAASGGAGGVLLLIDVENMIGTNPAAARLREQVCRLVDAAGVIGGPVHAVAAYSQQRSPRAADVLAAVGVESEGVTIGSAGAADAALLDRARCAAQAGYQDFVVASAARAFAGLAELGRLHVVAWTGQPVAAALTRAAVTVHRLPRTSPSATIPPAELTRPSDPVKHSPSRPVPPRPGPPATAPSPSPAPVSSASSQWPGGDPVRLVGQGALFGLGLALAARLVDYLLPRPSRSHGR